MLPAAGGPYACMWLTRTSNLSQTAVSDSHNFIIVYPEGMSDYNRETNNGWQSFNAMGSTTTLGNECTSRTTG